MVVTTRHLRVYKFAPSYKEEGGGFYPKEKKKPVKMLWGMVGKFSWCICEDQS